MASHLDTQFIEIRETAYTNRSKMSHGHGRGNVSEETEHRKEYTAKQGSRSPQIKRPDQISFGKNMNFETNYKNDYPNNANQNFNKTDFEKTQDLKKKITIHATATQVLQFKEDHARKYIRSSMDNERVVKPSAWLRGKIEKKDLEFNGTTTQKLAYTGTDGGQGVKPFATYHNLKIASVSGYEKSSYERTFVIRENTRSVDKELYNHNLSKGRLGQGFMNIPGLKGDTTYQKHFNETQKVGDIADKPYYGKDDKMKELLRQHDKGYFYTD